MSILVLQGAALGDFLLTLHAVVGLCQKWPDAEIEMMMLGKFEELVRGPGLAGAVNAI
jgi:ADP-heptose:LPS heptosyltransferase